MEALAKRPVTKLTRRCTCVWGRPVGPLKYSKLEILTTID